MRHRVAGKPLIGLTGGIGSGKSTVAPRFAARGAGLVDTDLLARELTAPGRSALAQIREAFGGRALRPDGTLDRTWMREQVFADPEARARLEAILHPPIRSLMLERAAALPAPYVLLAVPLLLETGQDAVVDRVLVVDCPEKVQIERVKARSGLTEGQIVAILASQVSRAERLARADDIIDNAGPLEAIDPQVERLHRAYLTLAASET